MSVDLTKIDPSRISVPKAKSVDLSQVSQDRISTEPPKEPGMFEHALERLDAYTGAPVRAAVGSFKGDPTKAIFGLLPGATLEDKKPIMDALKAYKNQFGAPAKQAPTPQDLLYQDKVVGPIVTKAIDDPKVREATAMTIGSTPFEPLSFLARKGMEATVGEEQTKGLLGKVPKGAAVMGVGAATDPLSYVPATVLAKPFVKVGGAAINKVGGLLPETASSGIRSAVSRTASQLTGVPRSIWENYIKRSKEVGELANTYQGEEKFFDAYHDFRTAMSKALESKKGALSETIDQGLSGASRKSTIQSQPLIDSLNNAKKGLDPDTEAGAIKEIDNLITMVRKKAPEGKMSPHDAYKLQRWFHERARGAYQEAGTIFNPAKQSQKAAKGVRYQLTGEVNKHFPDTIAQANKEFVELHNIDDIMSGGMLDPNATRTALTRAGLDPSSREAIALNKLSQFLHGDDRLLQQAKDLATFQKVGEMGWTPWSGGFSTSTSRSALGGAVGLGSQFSDDPEVRKAGALGGFLMTSPAAWKMGLDAGLMGARGVSKVAGQGGLLDDAARKARPFITALERRLNPTLEKGVKAAEDFILDEAGQFTPGQIKGFLKREGTYDLKKAREAAGPAKGLLPGEGGAPVAKYRPPLSKEERADLLNWIDSAYNTLRRGERFSPVDEKYLREVLPVAPDYQKKYVKDLLEQIEKQKTGLNTGEQIIADRAKSAGASSQFKPGQKITAEDGRDFEIINVNPETGLIMMKTPDGGTSFDYADNIASFLDEMKQEPRGLLTNLNVERGPVRELPEAGKLVDTVRENVGDQWVAGKRIGGIHKAELGPRAGKEFTLTGKTKEGSEASGWDALHEIKFKDGKSDWVTSNEVFHMTDPDSYRNPYVPSVKVGKYEVGPRNVAVDKNGNSWRIKSIDPKSGTVNLTLEKQAGGMREANLPGEKTVSVDEIKNWRTAGEHSSFVYQGDKAAQQAAEAKKVVSVDVPGAPKRGRAPETKPEMAYKPRVVPSDLKYKIGEDVLYGGRPAKIVQYNGNGVYTIKRGNSHDQVHMVDLKPKGGGKPTKPKGKK